MHYDGAPLWHTSVAVHDGAGPVPLARWPYDREQQIRRVLLYNLRGVGLMTTEKWERGEVAVHLRRRLTDQEITGLPALDFRPSGLVAARSPAVLPDPDSLPPQAIT